METMPVWVTVMMSLVGGGGITTIILALLGKIKTSHEKGLDVASVIGQMQETMMRSNQEFEKYCLATIERLREDNDSLRQDKNELKEVITNANDCAFLRANPNAECVVILSDRNRYRKKVCAACQHRQGCEKADEMEVEG